MRTNLFLSLFCAVLLLTANALAQEEHPGSWEQAGTEIREAAGAVSEATRETVEHSVEKSKEIASETKNKSKELWEKTKSGSKKAWETAKTSSKEAWRKAKEVTAKTIEEGKAKVHELTAPKTEKVPQE